MKQYKNISKLIQSEDFNVEFNQPEENLEVKYGLPSDVTFCKKCVISNQRPNSTVEFKHTLNEKKKTINFGDDSVCDACQANEQKKVITNWEQREEELIALCDRYRKGDGSYDCLVPGSGGKDSFYQSHILKYKYGMNPLTVTWAPHIYTKWGWDNFQAWLGSGFDNYLMTPNPRMHRLMTRLALENLFHPFQPFILGQKALAPKLAAKFNISLIFYGENEAEYGNPLKDNSSAQRAWNDFSESDPSNVYFGGVSVKDLYESFGVTKGDLDSYMPIDPSILENNDIQVHNLGYYLPWHPQGVYYYAVEHGGFKAAPERSVGTYSKYSSIDDKVDDFHYYTTYIKFGIGRATYDAAQEIRNEEITREEGVALVRKYDGEFPQRFADDVFNYLSIPEKEFPIASKMFEQPVMDLDYFNALTDSFRSPHLWKKENGEWKLRSTVWESN